MSDSHSDPAKCPRCGAVLPADAPEGLCPRCLAALHFGPETALTGESPAAAQPPLPPEKLAEHFPQLEILECLGRGGMGVVYKARQKSLNRLVALKLLAPERAQDATFATRFTREAQALAALNHPHIVTVYDFGQAGGFYYLLMEFIDGVNLRQAMNAKRFTPEEALAVVPPVCEALQYAHEHHIVHRDIKPENLLLDKEGRVKIADFGIAKMLGEEITTGVAESQPAGTPQYMAPEQKDHQRTDHRADIYSLGVVLYEMLTGELPADKLQPPSRKISIDVRLDEIVLRALEKAPELRYQTACDFCTQVETMTAPAGATAASPSEVPPSPVVPACLFFVLYSALLWFEVRSVASMPPLGATHFDINGKPNGWMHRSSFITVTSVLPLFYVGLFWCISRATALCPQIYNIPRKDYWLAPERKAFTQAFLLRWLLWLACILTVFCGGLHALVLQANRLHPPHLQQGATLGLILPFLIGIMIWLGAFLFRLAETDTRLKSGAVSDDWWTYPPSQSPLAREVCAHMTEAEKQEATTRGFLFGVWNAATFFGPLFCLLLLPGPLRWIYGAAVLVIGLLFYPTFRKMEREFLSTCAWARRQGITPDSLKTSPDRRALYAVRVLVTGTALALLVRIFLEPFLITGNGVAPEMPVGSRVLVWKFVEAFAPGDLIAYRRGKDTYVGRVVHSNPNEDVTVNRNGEPDQTVPRGLVIGKVVSVFWRGTPPATPASSSTSPKINAGEKEGAIGVALEKKDGRIFIAQFVPNTPAADGRLHVGDEVLNFGPKKDLMMLARGMSVEECVKYMRGPVGSSLFLRIIPAGETEDQTKLLEYTRQLIPLLEAERLGQMGAPRPIPKEAAPTP